MANLGIYAINTNGEYQLLSELTGLTFHAGINYLMQNKGGNCIVIESATKPTEGGITVGNKPFLFECEGIDIYIKTNSSIYLNISE